MRGIEMQGYAIKTIQEKGVISLSKAIVRMYAEVFFFKGPEMDDEFILAAALNAGY
jgi:hypothetical protein